MRWLCFFMEGTDNSIHNSTVGSCQQGGIYLSQNSRMSNCKVLLPIKPGDINMMLLLLEVNTQFM